jgi:hypothetical protein
MKNLQDNILLFFTIKRFFCFLDEWLFYCVLIYLWLFTDINILLFFGIMIYGTCAIITTYKNMAIIEKSLNINNEYSNNTWLLWPFLKS